MNGNRGSMQPLTITFPSKCETAHFSTGEMIGISLEKKEMFLKKTNKKGSLKSRWEEICS